MNPSPVRARVPTTLEVDARARSRGNDIDTAVRLATAVLARQWAAQIIQIRVDRAGTHEVAGIVLSGVKLRRAVDAAEFGREAGAIVDVALGASPVEEVDLWTTIPLDAGAGVVTSGDYAKPTSRTVFTLTVRRDKPQLRTPYWEEHWRSELSGRSLVR